MFFRGWSAEAYAEQLWAMGIREGDKIMVHTSLRAMHASRHDTPKLWEAYLNALAPTGTLIFPTHTYSQLGSGRPPFEFDTPCHPLLGAFPEWARKQPGVVRSAHPTHSDAGVGAGVERLFENHERVDPVGFGSPVGLLRQEGAKLLLIGCGLESCTLLHLAEVLAEVPYLHVPPRGLAPFGLSRTTGQIHEVPIDISPLCSRSFPKMEPALLALGVFSSGILGQARVLYGDMESILQAAAGAFRANPFGFLCGPACPNCSDARATAPRP